MYEAILKGPEFMDWKHKVNKHINQLEPLLSAIDLLGQPYIKWFDDDIGPQATADLILKNLASTKNPS